MENKNLFLIIIGIIVLGMIALGLNSYFFSSNMNIMENQTFDEINVTVPLDSHFNIMPNTNTYSGGSRDLTWITPYNNKNSNYTNIDEFFSSYAKERNLTEIQIKGLPKNSKAFKSNIESDMTTILVTNQEKNMAIIIQTNTDRNLAVKMANSVVFPE